MKLTHSAMTWFLAGLVAASAAAGALWSLVATHTSPPMWLVICLLSLALVAVFCFGAAEDLLWAQRQASEEPPEFGPARYTGPERRKGSRRPPERQVLDVNLAPEDAPARRQHNG